MMIIWYKDINRRVYKHDANGRAVGGPIEREYWQPKEVVKETSRSWMLSNGVKVPKNTVFPTGLFALTEQQVDDIAWFDENLHKVSNAVNNLGFGITRYANIEKLREVAKLIEYEG